MSDQFFEGADTYLIEHRLSIARCMRQVRDVCCVFVHFRLRVLFIEANELKPALLQWMNFHVIVASS